MFQKISQEIKKLLADFQEEDKIIFENKLIDVDRSNFQAISIKGDKSVAFIDGGQAEVISAGNFCLSFIRVFAQVFNGGRRANSVKNEFYLLTQAKMIKGDLFYESKIFHLGERLIDENDLLIDSNDASIKEGVERGVISKVANMARRFAELSLAKLVEADFVILDGTLKPTFRNEEKYLMGLGGNVCALAKTSSLFTVSGNSPVILLNKIGLQGCWSYFLEGRTYFVKLHEKARHVFRFEGDGEVLPYLIENCSDALFLGYPYGLIFADKFARVSNTEKSSLKTRFLLQDKEIKDYLSSTDAHDILDSIG